MTNKEIIKILDSNKEQDILNVLKILTKEGNNEILPNVISLLHKSSSTIIRNEVINIIDHLKEQTSKPILIDAIKNPDFEQELSILVSACWKNGLNYEADIDVFTDIFIKSDFQLAFDAFTVIDNYDRINVNMANVNILKLESCIEDFTDDKRALCSELINRINDIKENPA